MMDSTSALELPEIPARLLVIGGGYIGLELGQVYAALGSQVTLVEMTDGLLPGVDRDLVQPLARRCDKLFAAVHLGTRVTGLREVGGGVRGPPRARAPRRSTACWSRWAGGPQTTGLGLETTRAKVDGARLHRGGRARPHRRSAHLGGRRRDRRADAGPSRDAPGQGGGRGHRRPARRPSTTSSSRPSSSPIPRSPGAASPSAQAAGGRAHGEGGALSRGPPPAARPRWAAATALTKLVVDPETARVLGVGIVGPGAGELIAEGALAVETALLAEDLALTIHAHPDAVGNADGGCRDPAALRSARYREVPTEEARSCVDRPASPPLPCCSPSPSSLRPSPRSGRRARRPRPAARSRSCTARTRPRASPSTRRRPSPPCGRPVPASTTSSTSTRSRAKESVDTVIGELAEKWSWQDNYRNLVFFLRKDVKWHDGKPFTSKDVKFTFDMVRDAPDAEGKLRLNPRKDWYANVDAHRGAGRLHGRVPPQAAAALAADHAGLGLLAGLRRAHPARPVPHHLRRHRALQAQGVAPRRVHRLREEPRLLREGPAVPRRPALRDHQGAGHADGGAPGRPARRGHAGRDDEGGRRADQGGGAEGRGDPRRRPT